MENVTNAAVWGSLISSVFLGVFLGIQAFSDVPYRSRYALFAVFCLVAALVDHLHAFLTPLHYEFVRVLLWPLYGAAIVWLLAHEARWAWASALLPCALGLIAFGLERYDLATTVSIPPSFAIAALAHGRHYLLYQGYSSAVLCAYTGAMALVCASYAWVVATGKPDIIGLGYFHYMLLNAMAVFTGWIQLPREIRGRAPVRIETRQGLMFIATILAGEAVVMLGLLPLYSWPPVAYVGGNLSMLVASLALYFRHSNLLVVYADNVTVLLDERTASLREAQRELARQNEIQAQRLAEQERELEARGQVIERQRRLELAAQTAGQAAHDIQNLVSPILVQLSQLEQCRPASGPGTDEPRTDEIAGRIRRQVGELLELNGQLLALSRRGRLDPHPVKLAELLEEVRRRFGDEEVELACAEDAWVEGSWSQLSRALANLVANAIEARPRRVERVFVRCSLAEISQTRRCHLGFLAAGRYASIAVEDTGPGIPDNLREQIFEPFFSSRRGGDRSGSGLGLSIVTAVVDDHHGILDLSTGPEGTCFTIYLPSIEPPGAAVDPARLRGSETVLIADDDPEVLDRCGEVFEEAGYDVVTADDGAEALRIVQLQQVHVMLLDLRMGTTGGYDTYMGALHIRPGIKAVVHSSFITSQEAQRLRELGVSQLLQKPAGKHELLLAIRAVLDSPGAPSTLER